MEVKEKFQLPKNALFLGVLASQKEATLIDCVDFLSLLSKIIDEVDFTVDYTDLEDEEILRLYLGKYLLKGGKNIQDCLENIYKQFPKDILIGYKQAIQEFQRRKKIK